MTKILDNEYFTFKDGIITVKISSDMSNRTMDEVYKIQHALTDIIPECCYMKVIEKNMCFCDPYGQYPIDEHFDTTIY